VTWEEALRAIDGDLEACLCGTGPELSAEEVDRLTFCCCECCHGNSCREFLRSIVRGFSTAFHEQSVFHPTMFSAYHREGYRASMEAKVEEFLADEAERTTIPDASIV